MKSRRRVVALGAVVALLLSAGLTVTSRAQTPTTGRQVALGLEAACAANTETLFAMTEDGNAVLGRWVTIAGPTFDVQPFDPRPGLTSHAVDPVDPRRLLVSEGRSIQLSEDGGCTWKQRHFEPPTYSVIGVEGELGIEGELVIMDRIRQLDFAGQGRDRRVYALMAPDADQAGAIRVLVGDNAGMDWEDRSGGLPPVYTRYDSSALICPNGPCPTAILATSPSDPDVAYVTLSDRVGPTLFRTGNGGRSWERVSQLSTIGGEVAELAVSAEDPDRLWAVFTERLGHSRDGGASWQFPPGLQGVAGLHLTSGVAPPQVQVLRRSIQFDRRAPYNRIARSRDDGATWDDLNLAAPVGGGVLSPAPGGSVDDVLMATDSPDGVFRFDSAAVGFVDIGTPGLGKVSTPRRDTTSEPVHWFRQFAGLAAFVPGPLPANRFPPRSRFDPVSAALGDRPPVPGELLPAGLQRDLGAQGSETVDYRLELPSLPTPVDVWFLVDTSGSMAGAHRGLQAGIRDIVAKLTARGFDAWYGLGVFPDGQRIPYGRYADVAPPGPQLYEAIDRLGTTGGGNELHPTALYQSVTGAGQPDEELPAGLGASFRPEALKIIIHASDEPYGYDGSGPTEDEAAAALVAAGVKHVGLDLTDGSTLPAASGVLSPLRRDHDNMATETGTFAPPGGVDCNGNGDNELDEGDPFTCPLNRLLDTVDVAPAIIAAVTGIRDDTAVALTVADAGGIQVDIPDSTRSPVNVKAPNSLPFAVRYTCPAEMTGKVGEVVLRATVRGAPSAEAVARVGCGTPVPAVAPPRPQAPPAALVPVVIAPPQLVPDLEPGLSPLNQTAPAQVAQPSPQPGIAAQPGEVATAKQRAGRDGPAPPGLETGESRERGTAPATSGTIGAGAALAVALGGWAARRERGGVPAGVRA